MRNLSIVILMLDIKYPSVFELKDYEALLMELLKNFIDFAPKLIFGAVVLVLGWLVSKKLVNTTEKVMEKREVELTLRPFVLDITTFFLKGVVIVLSLNIMGVEMASMVAMLGASVLAIGLALRSTLENIAAGIMLIILRPFKVNDWVQISGNYGQVSTIQIFNTTIRTPDSQLVIVPNKILSSQIVTNFSKTGMRRIVLQFGISYLDDIDKAKSILQTIAESEPLRLQFKPLDIFVSELGNSSVVVTLRVWVRVLDYLTVKNELNEKVKKAFDKEGISIPFPQQDLHVYMREKKE